jgi:hypothetical protein
MEKSQLYRELILKLLVVGTDKINQFSEEELRGTIEKILVPESLYLQKLIQFIKSEFELKKKKINSNLFYEDVSTINNLLLSSGDFEFMNFFAPITRREKRIHRHSPFINIRERSFNSQIKLDKTPLVGKVNATMMFTLSKSSYGGATELKKEDFIRNKFVKFFSYKEGFSVIKQLLLNGELDMDGSYSFILHASLEDAIDEKLIRCGVPVIEDDILFDHVIVKRYNNGQLRIYNHAESDELYIHPGSRFVFKG